MLTSGRTTKVSKKPSCEISMGKSSLEAQPSKKKNKKARKQKQVEKGNDIWELGDERRRIMEFWANLGHSGRKALTRLDKYAVLKKMKEHQKQSCSCTVCGRRRIEIESQLEMLYNTYYEELEIFAKNKGRHPHGYYRNPVPGEMPHLEEEEDEDEDSEFEDGDDEDYHSACSDVNIEQFGTSLVVEDGMLAVSDEYLSDSGQKILDLMEYLAQKKIRAPIEEREYTSPVSESDGWDDYDSNSSDPDEDENRLTEQQRMEEGRRMFQIFTAKMIEQNILAAYREQAALDRAARLVQELEEEEQQKKLKNEAKQKKEKDRQRQLKEKIEQEKEKQRQQELLAERKKQQEMLERKQRREKAIEAEKKKQLQEALAQEEAIKRAETERMLKEIAEKERLEKEAESKAEQERREKEKARKEAEDARKKEALLKKKQNEARKEREQKMKKEQKANEFKSKKQEESKKRKEFSKAPSSLSPPSPKVPLVEDKRSSGKIELAQYTSANVSPEKTDELTPSVKQFFNMSKLTDTDSFSPNLQEDHQIRNPNPLSNAPSHPDYKPPMLSKLGVPLLQDSPQRSLSGRHEGISRSPVVGMKENSFFESDSLSKSSNMVRQQSSPNPSTSWSQAFALPSLSPTFGNNNFGQRNSFNSGISRVDSFMNDSPYDQGFSGMDDFNTMPMQLNSMRNEEWKSTANVSLKSGPPGLQHMNNGYSGNQGSITDSPWSLSRESLQNSYPPNRNLLPNLPPGMERPLPGNQRSTLPQPLGQPGIQSRGMNTQSLRRPFGLELSPQQSKFYHPGQLQSDPFGRTKGSQYGGDVYSFQ